MNAGLHYTVALYHITVLSRQGHCQNQGRTENQLNG